jgi:hypothetical protein
MCESNIRGTRNEKATASTFFLSICEKVKIGGPNAISGGGNNHRPSSFLQASDYAFVR